MTTTYILYLEERLIHNCKPFWVPWAAGISEWTIPLPAVIHCKSPGPIVPLCPSKSSCVTAPCHQIIAQNLGNSITCRLCWKFKLMTKVVLICRALYIRFWHDFAATAQKCSGRDLHNWATCVYYLGWHADFTFKCCRPHRIALLTPCLFKVTQSCSFT